MDTCVTSNRIVLCNACTILFFVIIFPLLILVDAERFYCQNIQQVDLYILNYCFFHRNVILLPFGWRQGSSRWSLLRRISSAYPSANSSKNVFIILASSVWFYKFWQAPARTIQILSEENRWLCLMCAPGISNSIYFQKASWDEFCDRSFVERGSIFYNSGCQ